MSKPGTDLRLAALRRFAVAITVLNVAGHLFLGFEQAWLHPLVALVVAYSLELFLELVAAAADGRRPGFAGGGTALVDFLLPAHITGLACAMLLYTNQRLAQLAFAVAVAIASKHLVRVPLGRGRRHVFNPSNLGISVTFLVFPSVGMMQPYMFTEGLTGAGDWILPAVIVCTGTFLNGRFTRRLPLIGAWVGGFVVQALVRSALFGTPWQAALAPVTGVAFVLFTFYMVTDPGTTPSSPRAQVAFGAATAAIYGLLMALHVVFGLFFALSAVCAGRGLYLAGRAVLARPVAAPVLLPGAGPARTEP